MKNILKSSLMICLVFFGVLGNAQITNSTVKEALVNTYKPTYSNLLTTASIVGFGEDLYKGLHKEYTTLGLEKTSLSNRYINQHNIDFNAALFGANELPLIPFNSTTLLPKSSLMLPKITPSKNNNKSVVPRIQFRQQQPRIILPRVEVKAPGVGIIYSF